MQETLSVINLNAIRQNALYIKGLAGGRALYAVVKADAYGHGAERVSLALNDIADGFCVALVSEGAALRIAGVTKPVLVFTPILDEEDAGRAKFYDLAVTVNSLRTARLSRGLDCHVKVNTGMNRYGCDAGGIDALLDSIQGGVLGVYSHLYAPCDRAASMRQLTLFDEAEKAVKRRYPDAVSHIAASGGAMLGGPFLKDAVRCGIALYGYAPEGFSRKGLKPALKVYARLSQRTEFIGGGLGYSKAAKNYGRLSVYRAGYADGFSRNVPLGEGNLCMDGFISEESSEWKEIFSDADAYAQQCGTISYETLCSATRRSRRVYINR
ncbi:MAG: alanine racemase [Clostridia bacterium]|nr:alanine racemase [Clostridia bacterium]